MPVHDWTRVDAGLFHHFHQKWVTVLCDALNAGILPPDYFALVEQHIPGPIPDVLTLKLPAKKKGRPKDSAGGVAVAVHQPHARLTQRAEADAYLRKASRITVRHRHGKVVAVVEIISPGNKASQSDFRNLVETSADLIIHGIHLLVIDLFPPGKRDPEGVHKAIWEQFVDDAEFDLPANQPLTLVSYDAGPDHVAYVDFVGVGDRLPEMPLFLRPEIYVPAPLERTYQEAWATFPAPLKGLLEAPDTPDTSD